MTEPKWTTWSCNKCEVKVALRANSKGEAKHWCKRQSGRYVPLQKETNDQTNPGGGGPAGSSPGSDARTERQDQPSGGYGHLPAIDKHDVTTFNDIARVSRHLIAYHDKPAVYLPTGGVISDRWLILPGAPDYRDALARAGGFGTYAGFLAFCEWVCGA